MLRQNNNFNNRVHTRKDSGSLRPDRSLYSPLLYKEKTRQINLTSLNQSFSDTKNYQTVSSAQKQQKEFAPSAFSSVKPSNANAENQPPQGTCANTTMLSDQKKTKKVQIEDISIHSIISSSSKKGKHHQAPLFFNIQQTSNNVSKQVISQQQQQPFKVICQKHKQPASKICTNPQCQFDDILFCQECIEDPEEQQHYGTHLESTMLFSQFLNICKELSCRYKQSLQSGESDETIKEKDFNNYVSDIDKYVLRYRNHIQKEEQKIDQDFDSLVQQFTNDILEIKTMLKSQLRSQLVRFNELSSSLQDKSKDVLQEKSQNQKHRNDFDDFLNSIGYNGVQTNKKFNIKKLISSILPQVNRESQKKGAQFPKSHSQASSPKFKTGNANLRKSQNLFDVTSHCSYSSIPLQNACGNSNNTTQNNINAAFVSKQSAVINTANQQQQTQLQQIESIQKKPIQSIYEQMKVMSDNKPFYKNKGEANNVYREAQAESRRIYHRLKEVVDGFLNIESPFESVSQFRTFGGKMATAVSINGVNKTLNHGMSKIDEINYNNNDQDAIISNVQSQNSDINHMKTITTSHKSGIICLKIVESCDIYLTGSADRTVKIWNLEDHSLIKTIQYPSEVTAISTLPRKDGSFMYLIGLSIGFSVLTQSFDIFKNFYQEPVGSSFQSQPTDNSQDDLISTSQQPQQLQTVSGPMPFTNQMVGLRDGESVVLVSKDHRIFVYNVFAGPNEVPKKYFEHRDQIYSLVLFPGSNMLATGGRDMTIKVFRCHYYKDFKNNCLEKLSLDLSIDNAHKSDVTALCTSAHYPNLLISAAASGEIKIWDVTDGSLLKTLKNLSGWVYKIVMFEQMPSESQLGVVRSLQKQLDENLAPTGLVSPSKRFTSPSKIGPNLGKRRLTSSAVGQQQGPNTFSDFKQQKNQNKQIQQRISNIYLENIQFLTASFDGTLKLWNGTSQGEHVKDIQGKNYFDCHPFGAVSAVKVQKACRSAHANQALQEQIQVYTTGNKNDPTICLWALK